MIALTVKEIATIVDGKIFNLNEEVVISQYPTIDSRNANINTFFVAIKGEENDGHNFIADAMENGATFALVSEVSSFPSIKVKNTLVALTVLAKHVRSQLISTKVIGITGSQGKTTTKDMLTGILSEVGNTISTFASFNNEIGLPLTILQADLNTDYLILEMGARHLGDINYLCDIAKPNIGVVLVVGEAHEEIFGSREKIALAKRELISNLGEDGIAVLGNYDEFTPHFADDKKIKTIIFGDSNNDTSVDVRATEIELREGLANFELVTQAGRCAIKLNYFGIHQIKNALAAAATAFALDISLEVIASALSGLSPVSPHRMDVCEISEILIINDAYNANPSSMSAALETLAHFSNARGGQSWAILGRMHELGASERWKHEEIGRLIPVLAIDNVVEIADYGYAAGVNSVKHDLMQSQVHTFANVKEVCEIFEKIQPGDCVLFKASRAEGLELGVVQLKNFLNEMHVRDIEMKSNEKEKRFNIDTDNNLGVN